MKKKSKKVVKQKVLSKGTPVLGKVDTSLVYPNSVPAYENDIAEALSQSILSDAYRKIMGDVNSPDFE